MTTFADLVMQIAEKSPRPEIAVAEHEPTYYCRSCDDMAKVQNPGDDCQKCQTEKARGYQALVLAGRCANGFESDHGTRNHAVMYGQRTAVCGAKPGRRSVGWSTPWQSRDVTCPRCVKKIERMQS